MTKVRKLVVYSIVIAMLVVNLIVFSQLELSLWLKPWRNAVAVVFSIGIVAKYIKSLSVIGVGLLVAVLTIFCPLILLLVIGKGSDLSLFPYFKAIDIVQLILPTMIAVLLMIALKWRNMRKVEDS
jgi:hypothetical protein